MVMLGPTLQTQSETSQETRPGLFFYDLLPLGQAVVAEADALQGSDGLGAVTAGLDKAVGDLALGLSGAWTYGHLDLAVAGHVQASPDYATKVHVPRQTWMTVPTEAIGVIRVRPRIASGPDLVEAITKARELLAESKYASKHSGGRTCGVITCACSLAVVDPQGVKMDASPTIDMQIRSSRDPTVRTCDRQGRIVESASPGRWYSFGLRTIVRLGFSSE